MKIDTRNHNVVVSFTFIHGTVEIHDYKIVYMEISISYHFND